MYSGRHFTTWFWTHESLVVKTITGIYDGYEPEILEIFKQVSGFLQIRIFQLGHFLIQSYGKPIEILQEFRETNEKHLNLTSNRKCGTTNNKNNTI